MITFNSLASYFPSGTFEFIGSNQVKINLSALTGNNALTLDSSAIQAVTMFLDGLAAATTAINDERSSQLPPLQPISFVSKDLGGTVQEPIFEYSISVGVSSANFINNLIDPTA